MRGVKEKLEDAGWTDRLTHEQTDNSEFVASAPSFERHNDSQYKQELVYCIMLLPLRISLQPNFAACLLFVLRVGYFSNYEMTGPPS